MKTRIHLLCALTLLFSQVFQSCQSELDDLEGRVQILEDGGDKVIFGNVTIQNQEQLSQLEGVNKILGDLVILGDVESLFSLFDLEEVQSLQIENTRFLENLSGLDKLKKIYENVIIQNNDSLQSINELAILDSIRGSIRINSNPSLIDLGGLNNIVYCDMFYFERMPQQDMTFMKSLNRCESGIYISDNTNLIHLVGLENLEIIGTQGTLYIESNPNLTSLEGLGNLKETGWIRIWWNWTLKDLCAIRDVDFEWTSIIDGLDPDANYPGFVGCD